MQKQLVQENKRALRQAISAIETQFGKGTIWCMSEKPSHEGLKVFPTRCITLDRALGIGGIPQGRIIEVYGPEASGKTTLMLEIIAGVQSNGGTAVFVDAEHALDLQYAKAIGVDTDALLITQPDHGEQALEVTDTLVRSGAVALVVIDSVAALVPKAEIEGEMGDSHMGLQARLMSQALRKLTSNAARTGTTVVFINQLRQKIGVVFGNPEVTTGGQALKYYASVRLDIRRIATLKKADRIVGNRTKVKVVKNKLAPPFEVAEFDILYGLGIDKLGALLDQAVSEGHVAKSGAWYRLDGSPLGQGREKAIQALGAEPAIVSRLKLLLSTPASPQHETGSNAA